MISSAPLHENQADLAAWAEVRWMNIVSNALFMLFGVATLVLLAHWVMRQPAFTLSRIVIHGDVSHNSVATIRANAMPGLIGNFFTMNLRKSQQAFESVPWVRHAVVQRVWPNRLRVQLEEHRAAAIWSPDDLVSGGGTIEVEKLVNTFGEVFEANLGDVEDQNLMILRGPQNATVQMLDMARAMTPVWMNLQATVEELALSGRGSWRVRLDTGAVLELGRGSTQEVLARCEQFVATVGHLTQRYQRPVEYADLRHRDGYALRLRGVSTTLSAQERAQADKKD
jgi:cell division protein FtsQ